MKILLDHKKKNESLPFTAAWMDLESAMLSEGLPRWESACNAGNLGSDPWVRKIPWRMEWQPNPVFLPGELHRQRSLAGYSPWGRKELDTTE